MKIFFADNAGALWDLMERFGLDKSSKTYYPDFGCLTSFFYEALSKEDNVFSRMNKKVKDGSI